MLENGPWFIRTIPLILNTWTPNTTMRKDDITKIPVWVKLHKIPLAAYTKTCLSLFGTKLGRPIMLDAYTSNMCLDPWGRTSYARALIEVSADQIPLKSLVVAIPLIDVPGNSYKTIEVEYEWQPPHCETCKVFGHSNDQCPKRVNEVNPSIDTNDGFIDVNRKGGKGKQTVKTNPISGIRFTKPPPKFVYRAKPKNVDNVAASSTDNNRKSDMQGKSDDVTNASKVNDGKQVKGTTGKSSKGAEVKTKPSNTFDVLASLPEEDAFGLYQEDRVTHDQRASNLKEKVQDATSKPSTSAPPQTSFSPSQITFSKGGNPFSKVGTVEVSDSDNEVDEVFEDQSGMLYSATRGKQQILYK